MNFDKIKAFAFDLDGTIVNSQLDFEQMRKDLNFPENVPILEHLDLLDDEGVKKRSLEIINSHEEEGASVATLINGVEALLEKLGDLNKPIGILTRNSKHVALLSLAKFNLNFDIVLSRDCCKSKPHPEGLEIMASRWGISTREIAFVGDHLFDMHTAIAASSLGVLYDPLREKSDCSNYHIINDYRELLNSL